MIGQFLEDIRLPEPPFYHFARMSCEAYCLTLLRMKVTGRELVPRTGPLIVACNHLSYTDPVALGASLPRAIWYMAKSELFKIPVLGPVITGLNAYPVERGKGDVGAIKISLRQLKAGRAIGIFPEGTRNLNGDQPGQAGVALLASLSGAPVLPAYVHGGDRARKLGKLRVAFGDPISFAGRAGSGRGGKASREDLENWTGEIIARIRALGEKLGAH